MSAVKWLTTRVEYVGPTGHSMSIDHHETGDYFWEVKDKAGVVLKNGCCVSTLSAAKGAAEYAFDKYALSKPDYANGGPA
jgi:hypothetical protein